MSSVARIAKKKRKRIMAVSTAGIHTGIQCLYCEIDKGQWHIIDYQSTPYPLAIREILPALHSTQPTIRLDDLASLDYRLSAFLIDRVQTLLSPLPRAQKKIDCIALSRLCLYKDSISGDQRRWNIQISDPHMTADAFAAPVIYDFIRADLLEGGLGALPVLPGDFVLAKELAETAALVNIGLVSRLTVLDTVKSIALADTETGPGTCCIDAAVGQQGGEDGFDRDGSIAAQGAVDTECLEMLSRWEWFQQNGPKEARIKDMVALMESDCVQRLTYPDRVATVTALTARTIFNYYHKYAAPAAAPETLWISGGGVRNQVLMEFLAAYFSPVKVRSIEEKGIVAEGRVPLSLALTVNSIIENQNINGLSRDKQKRMGRWIFPGF